MKAQESSHNGKLKFPQTNLTHSLNDNLLIMVRSWSGSDLEARVIEEITHFLSAADADLEVTTPFEYLENHSTLANKVRISILLANDAIYSQNKDNYQYGFEVAVCYKNQNEVVVASIGRFSFQYFKKGQKFNLYESNGFVDELTLLPGALLGIDKVPGVNCHSIAVKDLTQISIKSRYDDESYWSLEVKNIQVT